jgi:hypothetical protein
MNSNGHDRTENKVVARTDAPNPLWVITIGMAVFFGATAALLAAG